MLLLNFKAQISNEVYGAAVLQNDNNSRSHRTLYEFVERL
jgi:hypothetical protein